MHFVMNRSLMLAAAAGAFLSVSPALGSGEPSWRFVKPSNTGIPGDYVHTIHLDEEDRPWIPAYIPPWEEGGMARMNHDGTWTTISNVEHPIIASPRFNDIVADADGIMWIATDHGLLRYDPEVGPESLVRYDHDNTPMPASELFGIDIDPDGKIWLACHDVDSHPFGGLYRFDPVTDTWDIWTTANGLPWAADWPGWDWVDFVASAPDPDGGFTIWFGSSEMGMATYKDGTFFWYGNTWPPQDEMTPMGLMSDDPVDEAGNVWMKLWAGLARRAPDGTFVVVGYPDGLDTEVARCFAASGGRAFLTTYLGGAYLWDNGWINLGQWAGSHTYAFAEDSTGAFWTGGIGGAAKWVDGAWQRYRMTNTGMLGYFIDTITFDDAGRVYMNGNAGPGVGGFEIFDGERWTCVNDHNYGLGPEWGLPSDNSSGIEVRANGKVAIAPGQLQGVVEWDGTDYQYLLPQGYDIAFLAEDGLGRMWATGDYGVSYLLHDGWQQFAQGSSEMPSGSIGALVADEVTPGYVWIASQAGVAHTNGDVWTVYSEEDIGAPASIRCVDVADDGTLWVGTDLGMVHFDPATSASTLYTMEGTTLPSNEIDHVTIAPDGSIWMSTFDSWYPYPGGVTRFDGTTWTTWTEENSPLPLEQVWDLESCAVPDGYEVWIGTAGEAIAVVTVVTAVTGDLDGDGAVSFADLLILLGSWGDCPPSPTDCPADLDEDGTVSFADLIIMLSNWG